MGGSVIGSVASGVVGGIFGDRAADRMGEAQRSANALNAQAYGEAKELANPFISGGTDAFQSLLASYGVGAQPGQQQDFSFLTNSPDYQFALQQGTQALDRSAASKGRLYSGAQMQGAQQFGQGLATQTLGNYRQGLQGAAGTGINALNTLQGARSQYVNNGVQGLQNLGDISASRQLGFGNILGNIAGYGTNALMSGGGQSSYMNRSGTTGSSAPGRRDLIGG